MIEKNKSLSARAMGVLVGNQNNPERRLFWHRAAVLVITFGVYAVYHLSRRPLSIVKSKLLPNFTEAEVNRTGWEPFDGDDGRELLGLLDICFLGSYAVFMFVSGYVAERSNLRYFLSVSLVLCGLMNVFFGLAYPFRIHKLYYFIVVQLISGVFQTTGWPSVLAVIGYWFGSAKKGFIFGIWNSHTSLGNILGALLAGAFVESNWGLSFIVPGLLCFVLAFFVFIFLVPKPSDVSIKVELIADDVDKGGSNDHLKPGDNSEENEEAISAIGALLIPGVIEFSLSLFFTKLVVYIFLYWLPDYIASTSNASSAKSAFASITFDIGGCFGSIIAGLIADKSRASGLTCIGFLTFSIPLLYIFYTSHSTSMVINQILQFIAGFFINAPYALITTAVSANLACKVPSKSAMATVSAIIDGTGSIGAAIGPALVGLLTSHDWNSVMYLTISANAIAIILLLRIGYQELARLRGKSLGPR